MAGTKGASTGWRLMIDACRPRRAGIIIGVVVGLGWTVGKVSVGIFVQHAVDGIEANDMAVLRTWALAIAGAAAVVGCFTGLRRYYAFREARWIEADLRERLFAHIQRLHFAYHDRAQTGQLMSRANTDLQQIQAFVVMIPLTISNAVTVIAVTVILITVDPLLTLLALGSLPFLNVLATRFSRRLHPAVLGIQQESAELAAVVEETVAGVRVIKGFGAERVQAASLRVEADDVYERSMEAARVRATFLPALELLPNLGLIATLGYGGHQVLAGSLSIGQLVEFNVYVVMLIWPLRMLGMILAQAQRAAAAAERVSEVLETSPVIADNPFGVPLPPVGPSGGRGEVRFEGVRFAYAPELPMVFDGLDLVVPAGQSVAVVGATGSGKSTVARL
ncbi:MAG: ABC transporter ATP-binding protein, partial [Acidimicrobiales bacterium]